MSLRDGAYHSMMSLTLTGGGQCSTKEQLTLVSRQLSSLRSVIDRLLDVSIHYQLDSVSG